MFAIVAETVVTPENQAALQVVRDDFLAVRAQQPGYQGSISLAADAGRTLSVNVWASAAAQQAALPAMQPTAERLRALSAAPLQVWGRGEVVRNTLTAGATKGYARLAEVTYAPGQRAAGQVQLAEFRAVYAQQAGFRGQITADCGEERQLVLYLWESETALATAQPAIQAVFERLMIAALLAAPVRFLGDGAVVYDSLTTRA